MAFKDRQDRTVEYCIVRDNPKLRRMLQYRLKEYGVMKGGEEIGIDRHSLHKFFHGKTKEVSQLKIIRLCNLLGIKIELNVELT